MDHDEVEIIALPSELAGVWANRVDAHLTPHEFTLDFMRMDPVEAQGICVARVALSPLAVAQLLDTLAPLWRQWLENAFPKEVSDALGERRLRLPPQADQG